MTKKKKTNMRLQVVVNHVLEIVFFVTRMLIVVGLPKLPRYPIDGLMPKIVHECQSDGLMPKIVHECQSVSFIRQSRSLHYGRLVLSSVKRNRPLIIKDRVPLHETFSKNEELSQPWSNNDEEFKEKNDLSSERPSWLVRHNLVSERLSWLVRHNLVSDLPRNNRTDELFQPWSDNDEHFIEQNDLSEERPSSLVRQIDLSLYNPLYSTDQREELFQPWSNNDEHFIEQNDLSSERPSSLVRNNLVFDLSRHNPLYSTDQRDFLLEMPWWYMEERNDEHLIEQNDLSEERPSWLVRQIYLSQNQPLYNTDQRDFLLEMPWWYMEERNDEDLEMPWWYMEERNDEHLIEQNGLSSERPSSLVRHNIVLDLSRYNPLYRTDQKEELFQPSSDNDEDFIEQNGLSEERPSWLVRQIYLSRNHPLYNTDQREVLLETPWWYMEERNDEELEGWI
jgi:hypothetical protein